MKFMRRDGPREGLLRRRSHGWACETVGGQNQAEQEARAGRPGRAAHHWDVGQPAAVPQ